MPDFPLGVPGERRPLAQIDQAAAEAACADARAAGAFAPARVHADLEALFGAAAQRPAAAFARLPDRGLTRYRARGDKLELVGPPARKAPKVTPEPSTAGALIYAVGDVHGRYDLLLALLRKILADSAACAAGREPTLVMLGDYVDRGPRSAEALEALIWLQQRTAWRICLLLGNHEQCLLNFLDEPWRGAPWLRFGGSETLAAYGVALPDPDDPESLERARDALAAAMPASHLRLMQGLDVALVVGDYVFVHAGVAPGGALRQQRVRDLLWIRDEFLDSERPCDGVVVHGHTWVSDAPAVLPHRIGVDTGAFQTGALTAVRLDGASRAILQAIDPESDWRRPLVTDSDSGAEGGAWLVSRSADFTHASWAVNLTVGADVRAAPGLAVNAAPSGEGVRPA